MVDHSQGRRLIMVETKKKLNKVPVAMQDTDEKSLISDTRSSRNGSSSEEYSLTGDSSYDKGGAGDEGATRNLFSTRGFMFFLLFAAIATICYFLISFQIDKDFESTFESFSRETADLAENNAETVFIQLQTLATATTSMALDFRDGASFPNVTLAHFDLRAQELVDLTGADMIMFVPFVEAEAATGWTQYTRDNEWWIDQDYDYRGWNTSLIDGTIPTEIHFPEWFDEVNDTRRGYLNEDGFMDEVLFNMSYNADSLVAPISQAGPALVDASLIKMDVFAHQIFRKEMVASLEYNVPVLSEPMDLEFLLKNINGTVQDDGLRSFTLDIVKEDFREDSKPVGFILGVVPWSAFFKNTLPAGAESVVVVIESDCGGTYTYVIHGGDRQDVSYIGDVHADEYDHLEYHTRFFWKSHPKGLSRHCHFDLSIYPSAEFESRFKKDTLFIVGCSIAVAVVAICLLWILSQVIAQQRQKAEEKAARAEAIVASVFPKGIGERLIANADKKVPSNAANSRGMLKNFLDGRQDMHSKPIADLFPNTTVIFADIVGFTAWSSTRDPTDVFRLLETIYSEFDKVAQRRNVYKVETVGDCYVAVVGLPEPQAYHFVVAARFATDLLTKIGIVTTKLEIEMGPDTAELGIRIGLHSGPVTAGVLRGDRARFQLFGDTMNTAARIESTGKKNRIHVSKETAELLESTGKGHWVVPRKDIVEAKGKGKLTTFWLETGSASTKSSSLDDSQMRNTVLPKGDKKGISKKFGRLVHWNMEVLVGHLKQIEKARRASGIQQDDPDEIREMEESLTGRRSNQTLIDEVVDVIDTPVSKACSWMDGVEVELSAAVVDQLRAFISTIALMYNQNAFHNFMHASHVTMSVVKLLGRIVAGADGSGNTYGITSDPLTQFAVVLSAMLHDVDHPGVPNSQLVKEGHDSAAMYKNQAVAEQNSIDLAWDMLMEDRYQDLRRAIYSTKAELKRFRQMIVNIIIATDVMDPSLRQLRNERWDKAFEASTSDDIKKQSDRKSMIVLEHLIQASDVSHTMQHWQVYRKWNAKLFMEMYKAYISGRSDKDPSEFWYKGEIGFFDHYVIPLAKKLEECGVFGVSSDEYLNYAVQNRNEWEAKGESVVEELKQVVKAEK